MVAAPLGGAEPTARASLHSQLLTLVNLPPQYATQFCCVAADVHSHICLILSTCVENAVDNPAFGVHLLLTHCGTTDPPGAPLTSSTTLLTGPAASTNVEPET